MSPDKVSPYVLVLLLVLVLVLATTSLYWVRESWRRKVRQRITIAIILTWGRHMEDSIEQITKSYEWNIGQWSSFGSAILTAALGLISAVALSSFKMELQMNVWLVTTIVILGIVASILLYVICQQNIDRLKKEYVYLHYLLLLLQKRGK